MATIALTDATTWIANRNYTADMNALTLDVAVDELDNTTFGGDGFRSRIGGLATVGFSMDGWWLASNLDAHIFNTLLDVEQVMTVAPLPTEITPAYMFQARHFSYELFGAIGGVTPFKATAAGSNGVGVVRGQIAKAKANVSATGATGSVVNLGAVSATQFLYASFHVFAAETTITIQVQSDDSAGMATPTTQQTIGPITTTSGTWMTRVAGPITDTHYRFNVSAITGTFNIAGAIGIR